MVSEPPIPETTMTDAELKLHGECLAHILEKLKLLDEIKDTLKKTTSLTRDCLHQLSAPPPSTIFPATPTFSHVPAAPHVTSLPSLHPWVVAARDVAIPAATGLAITTSARCSTACSNHGGGAPSPASLPTDATLPLRLPAAVPVLVQEFVVPTSTSPSTSIIDATIDIATSMTACCISPTPNSCSTVCPNHIVDAAALVSSPTNAPSTSRLRVATAALSPVPARSASPTPSITTFPDAEEESHIREEAAALPRVSQSLTPLAGADSTTASSVAVPVAVRTLSAVCAIDDVRANPSTAVQVFEENPPEGAVLWCTPLMSYDERNPWPPPSRDHSTSNPAEPRLATLLSFGGYQEGVQPKLPWPIPILRKMVPYIKRVENYSEVVLGVDGSLNAKFEFRHDWLASNCRQANIPGKKNSNGSMLSTKGILVSISSFNTQSSWAIIFVEKNCCSIQQELWFRFRMDNLNNEEVFPMLFEGSRSAVQRLNCSLLICAPLYGSERSQWKIASSLDLGCSVGGHKFKQPLSNCNNVSPRRLIMLRDISRGGLSIQHWPPSIPLLMKLLAMGRVAPPMLLLCESWIWLEAWVMDRIGLSVDWYTYSWAIIMHGHNKCMQSRGRIPLERRQVVLHMVLLLPWDPDDFAIIFEDMLASYNTTGCNWVGLTMEVAQIIWDPGGSLILTIGLAVEDDGGKASLQLSAIGSRRIYTASAWRQAEF